MKEYFYGKSENHNGEFKVDPIPFDEYKGIHRDTIRACHDIFIEIDGGILLIFRKQEPAKNIFWPIGGGIKRGVDLNESIKELAKEECGLDLEDIETINTARMIFEEDPYGHGKGTDSLNVVMIAKGSGELKLNDDHYDPVIIKPEDYTEEFRNKLSPYVRDCMDKAIARLK